MSDDDSYQRRLEGRWDALPLALLRYRALAQMVRSFTWRRQLKRNAAVLHETARVQPDVDAALELVERRAANEDWNQSSATVRTAREVRQLREQLARLISRRIDAELPLSESLRQLEQVAVLGPRRVLPGQRLATAKEVLPESLPAVEQLHRFGAHLEAVFSRPLQAGDKLPFSAAELRTIEREWTDGVAALEEAWARLQRVDLTGSVNRMMQRRARRVPTHAPRNGPEKLLMADFWRTTSLARLREAATQRLNPVAPTDAELFIVARWLCERERDDAARLDAQGVIGEGRAGLFELAYELQAMTSTSRRDTRTWKRLLDRAERAEQADADGDTRRLKDNVRLLLRVLDREQRRPLDAPRRPVEVPEPATFITLLAAMRAQSLA